MKQLENLHALFRPKSIAIIGASSNPIKPGGQPLAALLASGYAGEILPVNPRYTEINGLKCYSSVTDIATPVDLAIIAVPAKNVATALKDCVKQKVKTAIIFTSGFAEAGEEGLNLQDELLTIAKSAGLRFVGPNCLGLVNAPEKVMANFAVSHHPEKVVKENAFAFISQSGGFGTITYAEAQKQGLGAQILVSTGNEADLDFTTFVDYMVQYTDVKAIGGYLEGVRDGKNFARVADEALKKGIPLLILKVGKHQVAAQAAQSHTGSMVGDDDIYQGLFDQKGIIRVNGVEEMLPMLNLISDKRLPRGKKIGILSTSGGGSVYLADLCADAGLEVINLSSETMLKLKQILPPFVTPGNPVDLTSQAMVEEGMLKQALEVLFKDPAVDLIMLHFNVMGQEATQTIIADIKNAYNKTDKPLMCVSWSHDERDHLLAQDLIRLAGLPNSSQPEYGAKALAALANYAEQYRLKQNSLHKTSSADSVADNPGAQYLKKLNKTNLNEKEAKDLLRLYNIPVVQEQIVSSGEEAISAAKSIGLPVVLKILSSDILHKTEVGGVELNLETEEAVLRSYNQILNRVKSTAPNALLEGMLVAEMLPQGRELILGIKNDQAFGNSVVVGLGGIFVEVLKDFVSAIPPLAAYEAENMLKKLKGYPILESFRNLGPADLDALLSVIINLGKMAIDLESLIDELEINPLIVGEKGMGVKAVDALVTLK
ncbi:MAG: acetate--CoA ligase family protein [Bacillota bacterium]